MALPPSTHRCPQCKAAISSRDVDPEALTAQCRRCGWAMGAGDRGPYRSGQTRVAPDPPASRASVLAVPLTIPRPHTVTAEALTLGGGRRRLRAEFDTLMGRRGWLGLVGAVATVGIVVGAHRVLAGEPELISLVVLSASVACGGLLAQLLSRYRIEVTDGGQLSVHRLLVMPWFARRFRAAAVEGFWITRRNNRLGTAFYFLWARVDGEQKRLLAGVSDPEVVFYLAELLERFLDLEPIDPADVHHRGWDRIVARPVGPALPHRG